MAYLTLLMIEQDVQCRWCDGNGVRPVSAWPQPARCAPCQGKGRVIMEKVGVHLRKAVSL